MNIINWKPLIFSILLATVLTGCGGRKEAGKAGDRGIMRYEQVLFDTPAAQLPTALEAFRDDYASPLLNIYPDNAGFMAQLLDFVNDSTVRDIYHITNRRYGDLTWLESELARALQTAHKLDGEIEVDHVATFVSGFFDYTQRILADRDSKSLLVSIDQYAIGDMEGYSYFGLPLYIVAMSDSAHLASDMMAEVARQYIALPAGEEMTMLDHMVMEGKVLYFLDQTMPRKADAVKIRYTDEQMAWAKRNESMIWSYFIQHGLLYEKDFNRYHNFVDEAPKTNAFKDSAPRTTDYIGWQIVRSYMQNNKCSLKELFDNNDSQAILQASKYRP